MLTGDGHPNLDYKEYLTAIGFAKDGLNGESKSLINAKFNDKFNDFSRL